MEGRLLGVWGRPQEEILSQVVPANTARVTCMSITVTDPKERWIIGLSIECHRLRGRHFPDCRRHVAQGSTAREASWGRGSRQAVTTIYKTAEIPVTIQGVTTTVLMFVAHNLFSVMLGRNVPGMTFRWTMGKENKVKASREGSRSSIEAVETSTDKDNQAAREGARRVAQERAETLAGPRTKGAGTPPKLIREGKKEANQWPPHRK